MTTFAPLLRTARPCQLGVRTEQRRWLVENLWLDGAVGILGGEPKCGKSFLALEIATAVASATPALGAFAVKAPGPVLLFAAEDDLRDVRDRLDALCRHRNLPLDSLDIHVITEPSLRLDTEHDHDRLQATVKRIRPRLLVLDPLVRLHRADENSAGEIAPILDFLRRLARKNSSAVLLVHHARKGAAHMRAGQALRGSSELHAWGDSNLYLRRKRDDLTLSVEHRAAAPTASIPLALRAAEPAAILELQTTATPPPSAEPGNDHPPTPEQRVLTVLRNATNPMTARQIRAATRMRNTALYSALEQLCQQGPIHRLGDHYALAD